MDRLEFQAIARDMPTAFDLECLEAVLAKTQGEPVMLNTDVKLAILHLRGLVIQQNEMNKVLVAEVLSLKNKKSFFRKLFRK